MRISRNAAIDEAEHDAIVVSRAFLGKEGEYILKRLRSGAGPLPLSGDEAAAAGADAARRVSGKVYTVQLGSFRKERGGTVTYERARAVLSPADTVDLRLEAVNGLYAVRVGAFADAEPAKKLFERVKAAFPQPLLLHVNLLPERILLPAAAGGEGRGPDSGTDETAERRAGVFDVGNPDDLAYDRHLRKLLKRLNIAKIKVFSTDKVIVYSTDRSIIGKDNSSNKRLAAALAGGVNSEFKAKDRMMDLEDEKKIDIDVVETYLPIVSLDGEILGAFEIYMDITRYRADTRERVYKSVAVIATVLFVVFGVLSLIMNHGVKELARIQDELFRLSAIDGLTGLLNRRYLFERLAEEFSRIDLKNRKKELLPSFGCIMVDIDFFKKFNDTYGHQMGDKVLKYVASCIEKSLRKYDVAGRYGGEEFLVLLPNSTIDDARMVAERIWDVIRSNAYEAEGRRYKVTVSVGYACVTEDDETFESAISRADQALYQAKEAGRDRVRTVDIVEPASEQEAAA